MEEQRGSARLGTYLRRLRTGYGFSLRRVEIRARAEGGEIDNSQLSRYERGRCYPSFDKLCILANIFNVSVQNFSDVLEMERYDSYKPPPGLGYEDLKAINPRIMEMRERLKDNPQQMQQEMMRIYREEKVNPMGGCFPIMVQIPVFIALYWVLLASVEMRNAPWLGWILLSRRQDG